MTSRRQLVALASKAAAALPPDEPPVEVTSASSAEWPWWLRDLEAAVGPIVSGRVYVIGARPSCGKTAILMALFWHLGRQLKNGALLSAWTERSPYAAVRSLTALIQGYDEDLVLRERWDLLPDGAEAKVGERIQHFEDAADVYPMIDHACPTAEDLAAALELHRPSVFILDYLQNIRPIGRQTTFDAWLATMAQCKIFAAGGGTVFIGSQLKRKGDGAFDKYRPPFMEDFLGGGAIEAGANLALGLFRPLHKMTRAEEQEVRIGHMGLDRWQQPGVMAIKVLKHTFWGNAADRLLRARISRNRRIEDYHTAPVGVGDAWEEPEGELPF